MKNEINILLTSVGRRSYLVNYFKQALSGKGTVHVANSSDISPAFLVADKTVVTPLIYDKEYIPFLLEYCEKNDINVLLSLFDIDLPILARNKKNFEDIDVKVIVSSSEVVEVCNDKWKTFLKLQENGFNVPQTFINLNDTLEAIEKEKVSFPLMIKPRWGMGSIAVYEAENIDELNIFYEKVKRNIQKTYLKYESASDLEACVLIQEKLKGQEYGLDVINNLGGSYQTTICKMKYAMRSGETDCAITVDKELLRETGLRLSNMLHHIGNLDVDVFLVDGDVFVLEMNARFGGGYPFSHVAGVNLPLAIVKWLQGEKVDHNILEAKTGIMSQKDIEIVRLKKEEKKMKKMLMLGTSKMSRGIVQYAKSKGYYTIVTDYQDVNRSLAKQIADEYWMINTADVDAIVEKCKEENVSVVMCGITEFSLEKNMEICEKLGLQVYCTPEAWHYSRDKDDFKKLCKSIGAPVAKDYYLTDALMEEELSHVEFPVVVKPVDMSGNVGVNYCYDVEQLREAYHYAKSVSKSDKIIVEKMLHGEEWYGYYAMANGEISLVALNAMYSQPGEPRNCYSITTTVSNNVERYVEEINPKVIEVLKKVGCREGIGWVQVMLDEDNQFYIIEMGYRLDGDMMFIPYKDVCNFDSIAWLFNYATGRKNSPEQLPLPQTKPFKKCACSYMLWTNNDGEIAEIIGLNEIAAIPGVMVESLAQVGDTIQKYHSLGDILFSTNDCDEMCEMISKINNTVKITNTRGENVLIYYTDFAYLKKIYENSMEEK